MSRPYTTYKIARGAYRSHDGRFDFESYKVGSRSVRWRAFDCLKQQSQRGFATKRDAIRWAQNRLISERAASANTRS